MADLHDIRIAIIATDGFEEAELIEPRKALQQAGAKVEILSDKDEIQGFKHHDKAGKIKADRKLDDAHPEDYDGLVLPGGALNADTARMMPKVRQFIIAFDRAKKPMAVICHAPWELISSGLVRGRKLTSWHTIQDDIRNAGGEWVDQDVIVDGNLVTSRGPQDLPAFNREMLNILSHVPAGSHR